MTTRKYKIICSKEHYSKISMFYTNKVLSFPNVVNLQSKSVHSGVSIEMLNNKKSNRTIQENISKNLKTKVGKLEAKRTKEDAKSGNELKPILLGPEVNNKLSFKKQNSNFDFQNLFVNESDLEKKSPENVRRRRDTGESNANINLAKKIFQNRLMSRSNSFNIFNNNNQSISPKTRKTRFNGSKAAVF